MGILWDREVMERAFRAPNGELAWSSRDVWGAIDAIQESNLAILGGEVWAVVNGSMDALPLLKTGGTAVIAWDTDAQEASESWQRFVERTAEQTRSQIRAMNAEEAVSPELQDKLHYNLCYVAEPNT
jgi:hypothetical protein